MLSAKVPFDRGPAHRSRVGAGGLLFRGASRRNGHALLLFLDARRLAGQVAQVVELGAANPPAADHRDVGDHGAVEREDALDTDAVGDLSDLKLSLTPLPRRAMHTPSNA